MSYSYLLALSFNILQFPTCHHFSTSPQCIRVGNYIGSFELCFHQVGLYVRVCVTYRFFGNHFNFHNRRLCVNADFNIVIFCIFIFHFVRLFISSLLRFISLSAKIIASERVIENASRNNQLCIN